MYHTNDIKMKGNKELKEIDGKTCTFYYFDNIILMILILMIFYLIKNYMKIF